jgi:hypothetical protein
MPSFSRARATVRESSESKPPRWKSAEFSLTAMRNRAQVVARISRTVSTSSRIRFSSEPPQRSVRRLTSGERNWLNR